MKNPEIQVLRNYRGKAPESFWSAFPFRSLPNQAETRVNVDSFRDYVNMALPSWPFAKSIRGITAIRQLSEGALPALLIRFLLCLRQTYLQLINMVLL